MGDHTTGALGAGRAYAQVRQRALAIHRRLPTGALYACLFIALFHAGFSLIVFPHPVARRDLREKILAVTENKRPTLVFGGDSRADCHIDPSAVARAMGLGESQVVNIGVPAGNSAMLVAAYREYADHFARDPVMVVSVSPHFVSNLGVLHDEYNFDYFWAVGMWTRLSALPVSDAIRATFAPERHMIKTMSDYFAPHASDTPYKGNGYRPLDGPPAEKPGFGYPETITRLANWRCFTVGEETSAPWQRLEADFDALRELGARVVVLDSPDHPEFLARLAGTPEGDNYSHYRATLSRMCARLNIPLLKYTVAGLTSADPDGLFWDGVHLNAKGAALLSKRVAGDLDRLIARGVVDIQVPWSGSN